MTADDLLARLHALVIPGRAMTQHRLLEVLDELARLDVERGKLHDQWVLLEVSENGQEVQVSRFFDFGDEEYPELNNLGVLFSLAASQSPTPSLMLAGSVGFDDEDRVSREQWIARATRSLAEKAEVVVGAEVFG